MTSVVDKQMGANGYLVQGGGGIETAGGALAINDMLLQSFERWTGGTFLRFFPVWPIATDDASFTALRANGAFLVWGSVQGGVVGGIRVMSEAGSDCAFASFWNTSEVGGAPPTVTVVTQQARAGRDPGRVAVESVGGPRGLQLWRFATDPAVTYAISPPKPKLASLQAQPQHRPRALSVGVEPATSWGYAPQRRKAAAFLQARFDPAMQLLRGVWAGGHGYEPLGYSLIDVNFLAQRSLQPYNGSMARLLGASLARHLQQANYTGDDPRENMFGKHVAHILTVDTVTLEGGYPAPPHKLWMVTERVNHTRRGYSPGRPYGVNAGVKLALSCQLAGDQPTALEIMRNIASWSTAWSYA